MRNDPLLRSRATSIAGTVGVLKKPRKALLGLPRQTLKFQWVELNTEPKAGTGDLQPLTVAGIDFVDSDERELVRDGRFRAGIACHDCTFLGVK